MSSKYYDYYAENQSNYTYSSNAILLKKSFNNIDVTVIIHDKQKDNKQNGEEGGERQDALNVLIDELGNMLNDDDFEKILNSRDFSTLLKSFERLRLTSEYIE